MTVSELITALQAFDPSLPVVTGGFDESDYDDAGLPEGVRLARVLGPGSHSGAYAKADSSWVKTDGQYFDAVYLDRA